MTLTAEEFLEQYGKKRNKYGAEVCEEDGYRFDSTAERDRYRELRLLEAAGEISHLQVHPEYELMPAFERRGVKFRAIRYVGDFFYVEPGVSWGIVEDVKGTETQVFRLKRKLFEYFYGNQYELRVVKR